MKRHLLGIVALALVVSGIIGLGLGYSTRSQSGMAAGVGLRAGLVLGAFWIAFPQLLQTAKLLPAWLLGAMAVGLLVVVIRPQTLMFVVVAVAALAALQFVSRLLRPPPRNGPRRRTDAPHASSSDLPGAPRR